MGQVIQFSKFDDYLHELQKRIPPVEGAILDTNVINTLSHRKRKFYRPISNFIKHKIVKNDIQLYTTVNTSQEYLDFYRRLLITKWSKERHPI